MLALTEAKIKDGDTHPFHPEGVGDFAREHARPLSDTPYDALADAPLQLNPDSAYDFRQIEIAVWRRFVQYIRVILVF